MSEQDKRFKFGENWSNFLSVLNEERIKVAEESLTNMLESQDLKGKKFLDIGSGSGLFSLVARRLGADVVSFDYDLDSVRCTEELKRRFYPDDVSWVIQQGSILDSEFVQSLGKFDIVYSWGVLHHTGEMWAALENASVPTYDNSKLYISIYNDQGIWSKTWLHTKKLYVSLPEKLKFLVVYPCLLLIWGPALIIDIFRGRGLSRWEDYKAARGMSPIHDLIDWVGGYPFEVAKPEQIFNFYKNKGFRLEKLVTCSGGKGCNEFVFISEKHN